MLRTCRGQLLSPVVRLATHKTILLYVQSFHWTPIKVGVSPHGKIFIMSRISKALNKLSPATNKDIQGDILYIAIFTAMSISSVIFTFQVLPSAQWYAVIPVAILGWLLVDYPTHVYKNRYLNAALGGAQRAIAIVMAGFSLVSNLIVLGLSVVIMTSLVDRPVWLSGAALGLFITVLIVQAVGQYLYSLKSPENLEALTLRHVESVAIEDALLLTIQHGKPLAEQTAATIADVMQSRITARLSDSYLPKGQYLNVAQVAGSQLARQADLPVNAAINPINDLEATSQEMPAIDYLQPIPKAPAYQNGNGNH